ncbi:hypothetical protein DYB31_011422 [Aphanomyces astaci]|nr:hypothetical protein DYB31_011422 [Aphanomyces astaci]
MVLAKRRLQELVRRRRARDHWRKALFGARMLSIMSRQFRRVHLHRLEQGQIELTAANEALQSQVQHLTAKLDSVEMDKQHLQRLVTSTAASLAEREARLQRLEAKIQSENKESLMLRIFKFFTCSSSSSVSSSRRQRKQSVDEDDESECSMTTCTSDESADDVTVQRVRITPPTKKKQHHQPPRNHVWKVSRFCF